MKKREKIKGKREAICHIYVSIVQLATKGNRKTFLSSFYFLLKMLASEFISLFRFYFFIFYSLFHVVYSTLFFILILDFSLFFVLFILIQTKLFKSGSVDGGSGEFCCLYGCHCQQWWCKAAWLCLLFWFASLRSNESDMRFFSSFFFLHTYLFIYSRIYILFYFSYAPFILIRCCVVCGWICVCVWHSSAYPKSKKKLLTAWQIDSFTL